MAVQVKICGITRVEDAELASELGADLIGLNFYRPSSRFVDLDLARTLRKAVAGRALVVGVFVNATRDFVDRMLHEVELALLQFHGDEPNAALKGWPVPVIRAVRLTPMASPEAVKQIEADYLLLDAFDPSLFGGTGRPLALDELRRFDLSRSFISGGLTPETVARAAALFPYGLDVASGVESAPGIKDPQKLRSFIENAKSSR
jgi:phosphoribosylanthranilate isomerase